MCNWDLLIKWVISNMWEVMKQQVYPAKKIGYEYHEHLHQRHHWAYRNQGLPPCPPPQHTNERWGCTYRVNFLSMDSAKGPRPWLSSGKYTMTPYHDNVSEQKVAQSHAGPRRVHFNWHRYLVIWVLYEQRHCEGHHWAGLKHILWGCMHLLGNFQAYTTSKGSKAVTKYIGSK